MRGFSFTRAGKRVLTVCMALTMGVSMSGNTFSAAAMTSEENAYEAYATETDAAVEEDIDFSDEELTEETMYPGSSWKKFYSDGDDEQLSDDEWAALQARCESLMGQHLMCNEFVNKVMGWRTDACVTATATPWLLSHGYYEVGTKTDLTNGTNFTSEAAEAVAQIRRGDILLFSNDDGVYHHMAIACVESDGEVYLYEGGVIKNEIVRKDRLAWYLSDSRPGNGYGDNLQIFRLVSNKTVETAEQLGDYTDTEGEPETDDEYENTVSVRYNTHIQSVGWQRDTEDVKTWKRNGELGGTSGLGRRLEAITIKVTGPAKLGIAYNTHIQDIGWQASTTDVSSWKKNGKISGTVGQGKRLEAIQIALTGKDADKYDVFYRVHVQNYGWLGWAKNGEISGTSGQGLRLEGIQVVILPKGELPDGLNGYSYIELGKSANNTELAGTVNYMTHVQDYGDQSYVYDGSVSGTSGEGKRLEGIKIQIDNDKLGLSGGIRYVTHVQEYGWQGDTDDSSTWSSDGELAGTSGEGKRLEAIKIKLYGKVAKKYDVYYRVHIQNLGWLGWAKNGAVAGSTGCGYRLEAIQIVLVPKGSAAPGSAE